MPNLRTDFLVIGSGISGLNFALNAAKKGKVIVATKKNLIDSSTNFAQGGIAAVLDKTDNFEAHISDTLEAGAHHNNKKAVTFMIKHSAEAIHKLIDLGVEFEKEKGQLKLTREGGHHAKRIAYVGDYTGKEIERILVKRIKENPNIQILENCFALNLIHKNKVCYGVQVIFEGKLKNIFAKSTVLATGGIGQIFGNTTNPKISTGDGIALATAAGCTTRDMEFIQFHPTALDKNISPRFLVSETLRGEGAKLFNSQGERFMAKKHPLKELAPRDIVTREIYEQQKTGTVFLDIRHKSKSYLQKRFPQIYSTLLKYGYHLNKDLIPITPAAHYLCGGIQTDIHGKTAVKNLFAFGEVTYTGVHGANRLASNSLLEALVFSNQITENLSRSSSNFNSEKSLKISAPKILPEKSEQTKTTKSLRTQIQKLMWKYAGVIRNRGNIKKEAIPQIKEIIAALEKISGTNPTIAETRNMAKVGLEILQAAYKRKASLGCHFIE